MPRKNLKVVPLGERQRLRILLLIATEPMSVHEVAGKIHMTPSNALKHLRLLRDESPRRAYIVNYRANRSGRPAAIYALGSLPDAVYEPFEMVKSYHEHRMSRLVMELEEAPRTVRELAILLDMSTSGTRGCVTELREMGWCYIVGWTEPIRRNRSPIYGLGVGKDKKQPVTTRAQRWKDEKRDAEGHEIALARRRAKEAAKKAASKPNTWFGAIVNIKSQGADNGQQQQAA